MSTLRDDGYVLAYHESLNGVRGPASGVIFDNRGGVPKTNVSDDYSVLDNVSDKYPMAVIREFNKTEQGKIVLKTEISTERSKEGIFFEFAGEAGFIVYRLSIKNDCFFVSSHDSEMKLSNAEGNKFFVEIRLDLDEKTSKTIVNHVDLGAFDLSEEVSCITSFKIGTMRESLSKVKIHNLFANVNYALYDDFFHDKTGDVPYGCKSLGKEKIFVENGVLNIPCHSAGERLFDKVSDHVIWEAELNVKEPCGFSYKFESECEDVLELRADGRYLMLDGKRVYEYVPDLWYRLRFEFDLAKGVSKIKLNGRYIDEVTVKGDGICRITFANTLGEPVLMDNIKLCQHFDREDYVPVPISPKCFNNYKIGINVCPLWYNGKHYGWNLITPYERPILGYYDEGSPETADWEIKYLVEHGVDFQAFCFFPDKANGPLKDLEIKEHLHDGFMNAKYSYMTKYCVIMEAANGKRPAGLEAWKKYYVPYIIENYFKDPRYMTIDNKPLFCIFAPGKLHLADAFDGIAAARQGFEYLTEEARKLGFDGVLFLSSDSSNIHLKDMGFDGSFAYGWGIPGYQYEVNVEKNLFGTQDGNVQTIPTVSVGFNSKPWWGKRITPLMTVEDYDRTHCWVKNEFLPKFSEKGSWNDGLVWLSTWNEFGEGTYLLPGCHNGGFGYLDTVRRLYTDEAVDPTLNIAPSEDQLKRINRMFPQHQRLLRNYGEVEIKETDLLIKVIIDGHELSHNLPPLFDEDGRPYLAMDKINCTDSLLHAVAFWDGKKLMLTVLDTEFTYTVGSNKYTVNGTEKSLKKPFFTQDGLPMLDLIGLCDEVGYTCDVSAHQITLITREMWP